MKKQTVECPHIMVSILEDGWMFCHDCQKRVYVGR